MCGIAGLIYRNEGGKDDQPYVANAVIESMSRSIAHRGPDQMGFWTEAKGGWVVSFAHRRLSIIDISNGRQPMVNADSAIVYNGEVYNFKELRSTYSTGAMYTTESDTEVVQKLLDSLSANKALDAFNGMFALGHWNRTKNLLIIARDSLGIKPLYYRKLQCGGIAFASEMKALLNPAFGQNKVSLEGVSSYLFHDFAPAPLTVVQEIFKLESGHYLTWHDGKISTQIKYYTTKSKSCSNSSSPQRIAEELSATIKSAVTRQLVSDVDVGVFLSGGIDSSVVTAHAAHLVGKDLLSFSIGFDDPEFDESVAAKSVADHLGIRHHSKKISLNDLGDELNAALDHMDEPLADASILPTRILSKFASQYVKVVLSGDGGDELFGGYPTYRAHSLAKYYNYIPKFIRLNFLEKFSRMLSSGQSRQSLTWKIKRVIERFDDDPAICHFRWMSSVDKNYLSVEPPTIKLWLNKYNNRNISNMMDLDTTYYLGGPVLTKSDRASMAYGLEVRPVLLDKEVYALSREIPAKWKLYKGISKYILKKSIEGALPDKILKLPKKGFGIPLAKWFRGDLIDQYNKYVLDSHLCDLGIISEENLRLFLNEHLDQRQDRSKELWALYVLGYWLHKNL